MTAAGQIAAAINTAAHARQVLAGMRCGVGFWQMPAGTPFVRLCWRNNLDRARRLRLARPVAGSGARPRRFSRD